MYGVPRSSVERFGGARQPESDRGHVPSALLIRETKERADALTERLSGRRNQLGETLARLDEESGTLNESLTERAGAVTSAREAMTVAEHAQESAREARTTAQVEEAQTQARVQVAHDRERRLAEEHQTASARLDTLRTELSDLSQADSALAEQMATWQLDLETREAAYQRAARLQQAFG